MMWFDKWDRKTLEYIGRFNLEEEDVCDKNFTFERVCIPRYPAENLEPGYYKISYNNNRIFVVENKNSGGYYKNVVYDLNGQIMYYPDKDYSFGHLKFTSGFVKILKRIDLKEI